MTTTSDVVDLFSFLKPKPSPFSLVRIGKNQDGAYLVPDDLDGVTACFSPGVNNFKDFEDHLVRDFGIRCHMCDFSSDINNFKTPLVDGMQTFQKKWLDVDGSKDSLSLEEWIEELEPNNEQDLLLQMDIEGAEYRNLLACPDAILQRFRIIILELHGLDVVKSKDSFDHELGPVLRKLDKYFICVHAHPNNCCGEFTIEGQKINIPNVIEVTLLNKDRTVLENPTYYPSLPHPLDISCNVLKYPPIFLNEEWSTGGLRTSMSKIKVLEDKLSYLTRLCEEDRSKVAKLERISMALCREFTSQIASSDTPIKHARMSELAEGKKFYLSSSYGDYPKNGTVSAQAPYFFHTDFGVNEFITIDLETEYVLSSLEVVNRLDFCKERARCLFNVIHNDTKPELDEGLPLFISEKFIEDGQASLTHLMGRKGRYITIFSPEYTALHLSSIKLIGRAC